jgi:hypothetical protein
MDRTLVTLATLVSCRLSEIGSGFFFCGLPSRLSATLLKLMLKTCSLDQAHGGPLAPRKVLISTMWIA